MPLNVVQSQILTDEEIENLTVRNVDARAVEAAVIAKLAGNISIPAVGYWDFNYGNYGWDEDMVKALLAEAKVKHLEAAAKIAEAWEREGQLCKASIAIRKLLGESQ